MKIDNYNVQMNSQYYNLHQQSTQSSILQDAEDFQSANSLSVTALKQEKQHLESNNALSIELSKAILQNINAESRKIIKDRVEITQTSIEAQGLNFSVDAKVMADGKEIEISMNLALSRSFVQTTKMSVDLLASSLKDPLVISLDGSMPSLSSKKFAFDIDSDGKSDQISLLNRGNGFLALDKNNNNRIDDGSELFGTKSGDGFSDLSKYDDDNNGWIDANDKIFDKLRIWKKTDGKDELLALGEVGIGAIFLGNTQTPFSLKTNQNELLGEIRKSGIVLFENAQVGIISHVDLVAQTKESLSLLETLQKDFALSDKNKIYVNNQSLEQSEDDDIFTQLQKKLRALEAKLSTARDSKKEAIQTEINLLLSQMLSLL